VIVFACHRVRAARSARSNCLRQANAIPSSSPSKDCAGSIQNKSLMSSEDEDLRLGNYSGKNACKNKTRSRLPIIAPVRNLCTSMSIPLAAKM